MKLLKLLIISGLPLLLFPQAGMAQKPCKEIPARLEIRNAEGSSKGTVSVIFSDNISERFRLNLIAPRKEENQLNLKELEIKNLSPGIYELIVVEASEGDYCPKRFKVVIRQI